MHTYIHTHTYIHAVIHAHIHTCSHTHTHTYIHQEGPSTCLPEFRECRHTHHRAAGRPRLTVPRFLALRSNNMHEYVFVCMCTYTRIFSPQVKKYACIYVCVYMYIHTGLNLACVYACVYVCMYVCMYACIYVCVCVCIYVRTEQVHFDMIGMSV